MDPKKTSQPSPVTSIGGITVIDFFLQNSKKGRTARQLNDAAIEAVAATKLPFSVKQYYDFAEKHLEKSVDEDLYQDNKSTYYREIITNDDELKCLQYLRSFYARPVLCDAGCGIGNMLHFTELMGYKSFGYEINTSLKATHDKINVKVKYGDLLTMDLQGLMKADVVYLYRPINNRNMMKQLMELIYQNTRQDVVIIYNYPHMKNIDKFETIVLSNYDAHIIMLVKKQYL